MKDRGNENCLRLIDLNPLRSREELRLGNVPVPKRLRTIEVRYAQNKQYALSVGQP